MRTPVNAQEVFPYFLGILALALLVIAIIFIVKRIRRKDTKAPEIVSIRTRRSYCITSVGTIKGGKTLDSKTG